MEQLLIPGRAHVKLFLIPVHERFQEPPARSIAPTTERDFPWPHACFAPELVASNTGATSVALEMEDNCNCEACKWAIGRVNTCLQRNRTKAFIDKLYHELCQNLPPAMQPNCTGMVARHFATLFHEVSDIDPAKACKNDCQTSPGQVLSDVKVTNTCLCRRCQELIKVYSKGLADKSFQQAAIKAYTTVCLLMPSAPSSADCNSMAKDYIPELMNMMSHVDPVLICNQFKYCLKKI